MYLCISLGPLKRVCILFALLTSLFLQACASKSDSTSSIQIDPDKATRFATALKGAEQGDASSQAELGYLYGNGIGVKANDRLAFDWTTKAAVQGNAGGQYNLGWAYANGRGTVKDEQLGVEWYRKAAITGHKKSQESLARSYELGLGSRVNIELAYFWNLIAANNSSNYSWLKKFELLLESSGQREILKVASLWKVGNPEPFFKSYAVPSQPAPQLVSPVPAPKIATPSLPSPAPNLAPPRAQSTPSMPPVTSATRSTGSGFSVSFNQVVTNAHVVEGCTRLRVNGLAANLLTSDRQVDLALITVNGLAGTIANIRSDAVRVGEDVAAAGYPLRGLLSGFNITRGNVSSLTGLGGAKWVFQITTPVQPGNSGGPLVDGSGNVAGVVVSKLSWKAAIALDDIPQNVNFAVNLGVLQTFLKTNSVRYQSAISSNTQMNLANVAEQAKHYTALVECL